MTEQTIELPLALTEQQRTDVLRFHETCEDDQGYDVPKARMKSLARVGLVRSLGFGRYEMTDVGLALVEAVREAENDDDDVQELRKKLEHGTGLCQLNVLWKDGRSAADATISRDQYGQLLRIINPDVAGISAAFHAAVSSAAPGIGTEPFAWIADYAAYGGGLSVFTPEQAANNIDALCAITPVLTIDTVSAATAAIKTLQAKGYTYNGAELWKPPVGAAPDFNLIDDLHEQLAKERASSEWMLHNGGTINEWAINWVPGKHKPLIEHLRDLISTAISANKGMGAFDDDRQ
ncbi:hypothetical protein C1893_23270 [Pseudomonas sp. MPR-ANC1]|uniref:hypothetical protein n=1 Tax=Pseudomonas sp. MPR-ANC1 TaxID=2075548 RepID=UPI000CD12BD1|nr:hypothetical protein [Pseudomonas sp. MPR-ANC1]POA45579.1 hypothetical protein C1893_23270 [Pseudomonas sp. MPR-ANC1]